MGSLDTMMLIAETFVDMTESTPLEKISVSDIVTASGKNRKTFYYHFVDKSHLVIWIFRHDLGNLLEKQFEKHQLVYEKNVSCKDLVSLYPYYAFNKKGVRSLDHTGFFKSFTTCLENRRGFYAKVLADNCRGSLQDYLYRLYLPALAADVRFILSNRYLKEESIQFLASFYTGAFLSFFVRQATDPKVKNIGAGVGPFANIVHSSLENEIKDQQLRRIL